MWGGAGALSMSGTPYRIRLSSKIEDVGCGGKGSCGFLILPLLPPPHSRP